MCRPGRHGQRAHERLAGGHLRRDGVHGSAHLGHRPRPLGVRRVFALVAVAARVDALALVGALLVPPIAVRPASVVLSELGRLGVVVAAVRRKRPSPPVQVCWWEAVVQGSRATELGLVVCRWALLWAVALSVAQVVERVGSHRAVPLPRRDAPRVFAEPEPHALVAKRPREEGRLGHARKLLLRKDLELVRHDARQHPAFPICELQLVQCELEPVVTLLPYGEVSKDKKTALRVVRVLEAVERRHDGACERVLLGVGGWRCLLGRAVVILGADESGCEDEVGVLKEVVVGVPPRSEIQLDNGRRVDRFPVCPVSAYPVFV